MSNLDREVMAAEEAVKQAQQRLTDAIFARDHQEYPKWVEVHPSHIETVAGHISVPLFDHHVARDGKVTVKVDDAAHEAKALAEKEAA
jgi:hypothetical protein